MDVLELISPVPESRAFLTVEELDESTWRLAREFPDTVAVEVAGHSREGRPILQIRIGSGRFNALLFGCPHPNEPIGAMTLEYLARELAENRALRESLDYTFTIIKCIDPDATRLNEGWFKGPFSLYNYLRHYYRPAFHEQVAWTFPAEYRGARFSAERALPETRILMRLIDELKPEFMYSLHNLDFGGAYWYLSEPAEPLYDLYYRAAARQGVPRKLGEAEVPYAAELAPAVFRLLTMRDEYDYEARYAGEEAAAMRSCGTMSGDYAQKYGTFTFVSELPYFFEQRIDDLRPADLSRREAVVCGCEEKKRDDRALKALFEPVRALLDRPDNHFMTALAEHLKCDCIEHNAQIQWASSSPAFQERATVAQVFDSLVVSRFFSATATALLVRACEMEWGRAETAQARSALCAAFEGAQERLRAQCAYLEEHMDYREPPIRNLVSVQAECGLATAQYVAQRKRARADREFIQFNCLFAAGTV